MRDDDERERYLLKERAKIIGELFSKLPMEMQAEYEARASKEKVDHAAYTMSRPAAQKQRDEFEASISKSMQSLREGWLGIATATLFYTFFDKEKGTYTHSFMRADSMALKNKQWQQLNTFKKINEKRLAVATPSSPKSAIEPESEDDQGEIDDLVIEKSVSDMAGELRDGSKRQNTEAISATRPGSPTTVGNSAQDIGTVNDVVNDGMAGGEPVGEHDDEIEEDIGPVQQAQKGRRLVVEDEEDSSEEELGHGQGKDATDKDFSDAEDNEQDDEPVSLADLEGGSAKDSPGFVVQGKAPSSSSAASIMAKDGSNLDDAGTDTEGETPARPHKGRQAKGKT
ncbi:hypothetical protein AURDEDRAFT_170297 [Auricularia subglabra TFB-10046 SS5]|nr:hypothetical protein AURDEDRAFT_170297 [Auricularia subglabra TFB-10046 SS5]